MRVASACERADAPVEVALDVEHASVSALEPTDVDRERRAMLLADVLRRAARLRARSKRRHDAHLDDVALADERCEVVEREAESAVDERGARSGAGRACDAPRIALSLNASPMPSACAFSTSAGGTPVGVCMMRNQ